MLEENKDYFRRKARQLGLSRADALKRAQEVLEALYPGAARAVSLNGGTLKITTTNASVAGELRLRQAELKDRLAKHGNANVRVQITIAQ